MSSLLEIEVKDSQGQEFKMEAYKGEVVLVVNVASKCGFTPQYTGLETLHRTYKDKGLRVLGFPCNDFGGQEPGSVEEIKQFCSLNYDVSFEIMDKVHAIGEEQHPLYAYLSSHAEPQGDVQWNFEKFLIGRDGTLLSRYSSKIKPEDEAFIQAIEEAL